MRNGPCDGPDIVPSVVLRMTDSIRPSMLPSELTRQLARPKIWPPRVPDYIMPSYTPSSPPLIFSFFCSISHSSTLVCQLTFPVTDPSAVKDYISPTPRQVSHCLLLFRCKMAITHVRQDGHDHLQRIADLLGTASKIVTVTGAGISTNAGIPVSITSPSFTPLLPD
jgi:hypothetical protein